LKKEVRVFKRLSMFLVPFVLVALIAGCGQVVVGGTSGSNENQVAVTEVTGIGDILSKSADYVGKTVMIEGKITQECGSGCWFNLSDQSGVIYIDIAPNNLTIPQKVGSKARVSGVVTVNKSNNSTYLVGSKVEF
jgi:hypothetical protein